MTSEQTENEIRFALANITGKGFAGDYGFKTAAELAAETRCISEEDALAALESLHSRGDILREGDGFSGKPVQCVKCGDDPCTCGIGTWR